MYPLDKELNLSIKSAKKFGVVSKDDPALETDTVEIKFKSITEDQEEISISVDLTIGEKIEHKILVYQKEKLTPHENTFIGWIFIILNDYTNKYNERAKGLRQYH